MIPFDSANYEIGANKVRMKIYRKGEIEVIDPTPLPYCFAPSSKEIQTTAHMVRTDLRAFDTGESVKRYDFAVPDGVKGFRTINEAKGTTIYEADKKYVGVWMLDNDLVCGDYENHASWDTEEDDGSGVVPNAETGNVPITAVGINYKGQRYDWGWSPKEGVGSEKVVLQEAVNFIKENNITLMKGWNSKFWDVPFFARRLAYNNIRFDFSSTRFLDLALCYRFMEKNYRSQWGLEKVGKRLFNEQKPYVNMRLRNLPIDQLRDRVGWDAEMTEKIDVKKNYSKVAIQMAKMGHIFPDQIFGVHPEKHTITVTPVLDQFYLKYAHKLNYVLNCKTGYNQRPKYPGAWVEVWKMGFFKDVLQFDVDSLYPNVMLAYKLAPYGKFDLEEPIIRDLLAGKRNAQNEIERWAFKIAVNANYGLMASSHYRFKAVQVADDTCRFGREIVRSSAEFLRGLGYDVYYMDTDSNFVHGTVEEAPVIKELINNYIQKTFGFENIKFNLEAHWSTIGFPRGAKGEKAKKRYYGIVHMNKKGQVVDEFEEAGMEGLRGDWCELAKMMQDTIKKMQVQEVSLERMLEFYEDTKVKLFDGEYDPLLLLEKHMSKDESQYGLPSVGKDGKTRKTGVPQHVKALRAALQTDWVPNEMMEYNVVVYQMVKGAIPKLANLVQPGELDYSWYLSHQKHPLMWRLGLIETVTKYQKSRPLDKAQTTLT